MSLSKDAERGPRILLPKLKHFESSDGTTVACYAAGDRPPLVLVDFSAECRLITSIPCFGFGKRKETGLVDATR
jgi:hypothetical protein